LRYALVLERNPVRLLKRALIVPVWIRREEVVAMESTGELRERLRLRACNKVTVADVFGPDLDVPVLLVSSADPLLVSSAPSILDQIYVLTHITTSPD
jgi:hypothetical protein